MKKGLLNARIGTCERALLLAVRGIAVDPCLFIRFPNL